MSVTVTALSENISEIPGLEPDFGLSLHIKLNDKTILLDAGSTGKCLDNAKKLGIDLASLDAMVLSHGHFDHTDGVIKLIENGMTNILYFAWYLLSEYNLRMKKYDVTYGIVNNAIIQLEKSDYANEYLILLFKYNMFKVLMFMKQYDSAKLCIEQAVNMAQKKGINIEFDLDPAHYEAEDMEESTEGTEGTEGAEGASGENAFAEGSIQDLDQLQPNNEDSPAQKP